MTIPVDHEGAPEGQTGREPKLVDVRESIRYRRRAQEAEQRCADLEAELQELRLAQNEQAQSQEAALNHQRQQREQTELQVQQLQTERQIERELIRAGTCDPETALLLVRERLAAAGDQPVDIPELVGKLLEEKPHLKASYREPVPPIGRPSQGVRPTEAGGPTRLKRLAVAARSSGQRGDLVQYMRARRTAAP